MGYKLQVISFLTIVPRDPITLSDDEQGVSNHLRNARYLSSMKPFSEGEPGSLQGGPLPVINGVITLINALVTG